MKNIITQDGCWNCQFHLYEKDLRNWVEWPNFYCGYDKTCPSTHKNWEHENEDGSELAQYNDKFETTNDEVLMERHSKMYQWQKKHTVESYQKCDNWTEIKKQDGLVTN
jgi:hypothetical protein